MQVESLRSLLAFECPFFDDRETQPYDTKFRSRTGPSSSSRMQTCKGAKCQRRGSDRRYGVSIRQVGPRKKPRSADGSLDVGAEKFTAGLVEVGGVSGYDAVTAAMLHVCRWQAKVWFGRIAGQAANRNGHFELAPSGFLGPLQGHFVDHEMRMIIHNHNHNDHNDNNEQ